MTAFLSGHWDTRSARLAFLLVAVLLLGPTGCGFRPLYGRHQSAEIAGTTERMAGIRIGQIIDRNGQILRNDLVERLTPQGEPANPQYTLSVLLNESMAGLGQQTNSYATLGEMQVTATFTLRDGDGKEGFVGTSVAVVSVNFLGPRYGSVAVERDAEARGLSQLADDMRDQIASYMANPKSRVSIRPPVLHPLDGDRGQP